MLPCVALCLAAPSHVARARGLRRYIFFSDRFPIIHKSFTWQVYA